MSKATRTRLAMKSRRSVSGSLTEDADNTDGLNCRRESNEKQKLRHENISAVMNAALFGLRLE